MDIPCPPHGAVEWLYEHLHNPVLRVPNRLAVYFTNIAEDHQQVLLSRIRDEPEIRFQTPAPGRDREPLVVFLLGYAVAEPRDEAAALRARGLAVPPSVQHRA